MVICREERIPVRRGNKTGILEKMVSTAAVISILIVIGIGKYRMTGNIDPVKLLFAGAFFTIMLQLGLQIWRNGKK